MTFGKFFLPGPTEVRPSVLAAMQKPMIGHRGKSMEDLIALIEPDLQYVFRTTRPVYIASASARLLACSQIATASAKCSN